jgi:hypothetical protein
MGCINLTSITIRNPKPPKVNPGAFTSRYINNACLYVPISGFFAYRAADVWKEFDCIRPIIFYEMDYSWLVLSIPTALILFVAIFVIIRKLRKQSLAVG